MGKPVKLMWHRADDARVGRGHPMCTSRIAATYARQRGARLPAGAHQHRDRLPARPRRADLRQGRRPADRARQPRLRRDDLRADPGGPLRLRCRRPDPGRDRRPVQHRQHAQHLLARRPRRRRAGRRPARRRRWARTPTSSGGATCATTGSAPSSTPSPRPATGAGRCQPRTAQGIAIHKEYKGASACLVEIDCRPETVDRQVRDGVTGPRVTKVVFAIDVGLVSQPARPRGPDAGRDQRRHRARPHLEHAPARRALPRGQLGQLLLHAAVERPARRRGDRDAVRQRRSPGGAGEAGVAATFAAVACAYARATGTGADVLPDQPPRPARVHAQAVSSRRSRRRRPTASS